MLTELCEYLKNWFDTDQPKRFAKFTVESGKVAGIGDMLEVGQYYRIVGSTFNDGVYQYTEEPNGDLQDETFTGAIWAMRIPKRALKLANDIQEWMDKYGGIDSQSMSPYQSESFGGYSYSKSNGGASSDTGSGSWEDVFKSRLVRWRKI